LNLTAQKIGAHRERTKDRVPVVVGIIDAGNLFSQWRKYPIVPGA